MSSDRRAKDFQFEVTGRGAVAPEDVHNLVQVQLSRLMRKLKPPAATEVTVGRICVQTSGSCRDRAASVGSPHKHTAKSLLAVGRTLPSGLSMVHRACYLIPKRSLSLEDSSRGLRWIAIGSGSKSQDPDGVRSSRQATAVWGHDGKLTLCLVPEKNHFLARGGVPDSRRLIVGGRNDEAAIRAEQSGLHSPEWPSERHKLLAGPHVEQAKPVLAICRATSCRRD